jgi:hypothetical protein
MKVKLSNKVIKNSITVLLECLFSSYSMKVCSDYVQVLCLQSANQLPCTHRVGIKLSVSGCFYLNVRLLFVQYCTLHTGLVSSATGRRKLHVSGTLSCTFRFPVICKRVFLLVEFIPFWYIVLTQKIRAVGNHNKFY